MSDFLTHQQRSKLMAAVRGSGNLTTEGRMAEVLRKARISGWRRKCTLPGRPDFYFPAKSLCVFIHGCFWHVCPKCFTMPKSNIAYWRRKFADNQARDKRVERKLRRTGYSVLVVWECQLKDEKKIEGVLRKLKRSAERRRI